MSEYEVKPTGATAAADQETFTYQTRNDEPRARYWCSQWRRTMVIKLRFPFIALRVPRTSLVSIKSTYKVLCRFSCLPSTTERTIHEMLALGHLPVIARLVVLSL